MEDLQGNWLAWAWIPIVLASAAAQTVRNAAQRSLIKTAGVLPATLVRFFYGLPFAVLGYAVEASWSREAAPAVSLEYLAWIAAGAVAQLLATAFFIAAMEQRSFVVAVVYSKTEVIQIAIISAVLLTERLSIVTLAATVVSTTGVLLMSVRRPDQGGSGLSTWFSSSARLGLAAGGAFAVSAVGYRGAMIALGHREPWMSGLLSVVWAQAMQIILLGGYLVARDRAGLRQIFRDWRMSMVAGLMGALASMGWLTAYAMRSAVDVRVVGMAEVLFSYAMTRRYFKEHVAGRELLGIVAVLAGIVVITVA
jgi:drug/metabolite transporter (DMT)-like permease